MVLTITGFSGCGKSHLSTQFARELRWDHFCCDNLIESKLEAELSREELPGTRRVAHWLGLPFSSDFASRQARYLSAEEEIMVTICETLNNRVLKDTVVDTTGSVIYMPTNILETLRAKTQVIYLRMPVEDEEAMFEQFINDPKPLIWRDIFEERPGESSESALHRCFTELLHERTRLYESWSHKSISAGFADRSELTPAAVLKRLKM